VSKIDGFEQREQLGPSYWKDPRWKKVGRLRFGARELLKRNLLKEAKTLVDESNGLVCEIHRSWGID
jgi:hypothetical protein